MLIEGLNVLEVSGNVTASDPVTQSASSRGAGSPGVVPAEDFKDSVGLFRIVLILLCQIDCGVAINGSLRLNLGWHFILASGDEVLVSGDVLAIGE